MTRRGKRGGAGDVARRRPCATPARQRYGAKLQARAPNWRGYHRARRPATHAWRDGCAGPTHAACYAAPRAHKLGGKARR
eukprot:7010634-Alexandrium_andersonii.AAC.1